MRVNLITNIQKSKLKIKLVFLMSSNLFDEKGIN